MQHGEKHVQLSFRQGIVRYQTPLSGPTLLQRTPLSNTSVDLIVVPNEPVLITFAHYTTNYLISENTTVSGAWGSGAVGSTNGPLAMNQTQYLYWDIDLATGALTRGWTSLAPIYTSQAPTNPHPGQMWFDNIHTVWNVFTQSTPTSIGVWQNKIRCFAGIYQSNGVLVPMPIGSQVPPPPGIVGIFSAGNLLLGTNNQPLKNSDGTFVTTATQLIVQETSGQNVTFDAALAWGEAAQDIPAFYLVSFGPNKTISLASSNNYSSFVSGIVTDQLYEEEVGRVVINGVVRYDQWNWPIINAPLFCGPSGQVTLTPPPIGVIQQIGTTYDSDAIVLNIGPPVRIRT
jgi:hypothetical protein